MFDKSLRKYVNIKIIFMTKTLYWARFIVHKLFYR